MLIQFHSRADKQPPCLPMNVGIAGNLNRNEYELVGVLASAKYPPKNPQTQCPSTLSNGRMNYKIWSGLTVALLTSTFGATSTHAESKQTVNQDLQPHLAPVTPPTPSTGSQLVVTPTDKSSLFKLSGTDTIKMGEYQSQTTLEKDDAAIFKVHPHQFGEYRAATLYIRNIPAITFLSTNSIPSNGIKMGETADTDNKSFWHHLSKSKTIPLENEPVWRATAVAAKLNQLNRDGVNASKINVRWKAKCDCYGINLNTEELVEINQKTILPDTTRDLGEDALQATNRIRRLMGNAPPLQVIADKPQPKPVTIANKSITIPVTNNSGFITTNKLVAKAQPIVFLPVLSRMSGIASWYGTGYEDRLSANGETLNRYDLTAAHRTLPFGTKVRVTNLNNGLSVVVRINDRGPFIDGRVIDMSHAAAQAIRMQESGIAPVQLEVLGNSQQVAIERQ